MNWYIGVLKKYAVFNGRARRKEYWFFVLFSIIVAAILSMIDRVTGTYSSDAGMGFLGGVYALAVILPSIGVSIRRLHDTGRTGWWILLVFVPVIGAIVLIIFMILDGQPGTNQYGPNPKGEGPTAPVPA